MFAPDDPIQSINASQFMRLSRAELYWADLSLVELPVADLSGRTSCGGSLCIANLLPLTKLELRLCRHLP